MALFEVNTQAIAGALASLGLSKKHSRQIARGVGSAALATWKQLAQSELKSSARDYIQGLQMESPESGKQGFAVRIVLNGVVPNLIENGFAGGNMRTWMLKSPKAKAMKGGGRYLVVPFRHGVPGTKGRNVGLTMPASIHRAAKQLAGTTTSIFEPTRHGQTLRSQTTWGGRLTQQALPGLKLSNKGRNEVSSKLKELRSPWHTTSIWTGMVRNEAAYEKARQSSYTTFRTISSRQRDPRSWMHPGVTARHFATRTQDKITGILAQVVLQVIRGEHGQKK